MFAARLVALGPTRPCRLISSCCSAIVLAAMSAKLAFQLCAEVPWGNFDDLARVYLCAAGGSCVL